MADFPEESWATAGPRWRARFSTATGGLRSKGTGRGPDPGDERIRQLERLEALRASGVLSESELAAEKARILDDEGNVK